VARMVAARIQRPRDFAHRAVCGADRIMLSSQGSWMSTGISVGLERFHRCCSHRPVAGRFSRCFSPSGNGPQGRGYSLIFAKRVVWIAIQPALARLRRRNHRMLRRARVFARVTIRRAVAAKSHATYLARPQMYPSCADFHAFFAFAALRLLDGFDRIEMRTASVRHWFTFCLGTRCVATRG